MRESAGRAVEREATRKFDYIEREKKKEFLWIFLIAVFG
jgi:hypothetical protein